MRDCTDAMLKDRLPDLLRREMPADERARLQQHVDSCEDCRTDLDILRRVVTAMPAVTVDTARVAAAIGPYRPSRWRVVLRMPMVRAAAAVVLLAGGAAAILTLRQKPTTSTAAVVAAQLAPVTDTPSVVAPGSGVRAGTRGELAVGETLNDLSDSELRTLLDEVGRLDAMTSAETEIVVPGVDRSGR